MSKTIVNLSISVVDAATAEILERYPQYPHQHLFADPSLRQKLVVHVLSRMPGHYVVIDEENAEISSQTDCSVLTEAEQQQIQQLIHEGIQQLVSQYPNVENSSEAVPEALHRIGLAKNLQAKTHLLTEMSTLSFGSMANCVATVAVIVIVSKPSRN